MSGRGQWLWCNSEDMRSKITRSADAARLQELGVEACNRLDEVQGLVERALNQLEDELDPSESLREALRVIRGEIAGEDL